MMRDASRAIDRRTLLIGGGAAAGLAIAWWLWPRAYAPNLRAGAGETMFNAFVKIGVDGRVIVAVPQAEIGQGVYTSLPQILADELGADWSSVAVEPAPISPLYANLLLAGEAVAPGPLEGFRRWRVEEGARGEAAMLTGGSSSVRMFEPLLREAGAAARALLMQAAGARWDVDWHALDTADGFVVDGARRLSFAALAAEAADFPVPAALPLRADGGPGGDRLAGQSLPRLDTPAKIDGSARFAGDIRLPDMLFASVRQGPHGGARLLRIDRAAAHAVPGVVALFENDGWAGAAATNWWAADRAVQAMRPIFGTRHTLASTRSIDAALQRALAEGPEERLVAVGDAEAALAGEGSLAADYAVGAVPTAALEPLAATARLVGDRLEIWAPTQAPALARSAAARATGLPAAQVTVYQTLIGSGYGRKMEVSAIAQAAMMAMRLRRPVQLCWSRTEEMLQDGVRPPARARLRARMAANGTLLGWHARIAVPDTAAQTARRAHVEIEDFGARASAAATAGAAPPYAIAAVAIDHVPADIGVRTGGWRSEAHGYTAFFTECFVDELARVAGIEPLSFRMQMLGDNPRLARVLATAAALAGWDGGVPGSTMGLAAHSAFGSHVATVVEVEAAAAGPRVRRAVAAVDCGRVVNPDIVRQQIEGGIVYGIAGATGRPVGYAGGLPDVRRLGALGLPRLADTPEIVVEIIASDAPPGGVTELGVPTVAPAIANALFALTGRRTRTMPLGAAA